MDGLSTDGRRRAVCIVDIGNRWNEVARAYVSNYAGMAVPIYYFGLVDEARIEWILDDTMTHVKNLFLDGKILVPGHIPMPEQIASDGAPVDAMKPEMRLCSLLGCGVKSEPKVPESVDARWKNHPEYGADYRAWVEKAAVMTNDAGNPPPAKRRKTEVKDEVGGLAPDINVDIIMSPVTDDMAEIFRNSLKVMVPNNAGMNPP